MYLWRNLTPEQREEVLRHRRLRDDPKHSIPHWESTGVQSWMLSGACFEHGPIVGITPERMSEWEQKLLAECSSEATEIFAWCVLPNHYHILLATADVKTVLKKVGLLHGATSFLWNKEDEARERHVWCNCAETLMKNERHFFATLNYVHHNPVLHGYADRWQDWPWSSATQFLERVGRKHAVALWRNYSIATYGVDWDRSPKAR